MFEMNAVDRALERRSMCYDFGSAPAAPATPTADQYQTQFQKILANPLAEFAVDKITRATNAGFTPYDTEKLKMTVDPALKGVYDNLNARLGAGGASDQIDMAANNFVNPTLNKNFLTFNKDDFYNSQMGQIRRDTAETKQQNRDALLEAGIGNSTILGNQNDLADKRLMAASGDAAAKASELFYNAGINAQKLGNDATLAESTIAAENNKNKINALNLGNTIRNQNQSALLGVADKMQQTDLYNKNADYNEFLRKQNENDKNMQTVTSLFTGQMPAQVAGMNAAQANNMAYYNAQNQAAANQNNLFGSLIGLAGGGIK